MGEHVKVFCRKCKKELDEVWAEGITNALQIEIDADSCACFEDALQEASEAAYAEGYDEGRASKND